jgi:ankyrin repeat protein
MDLLRSFFRDDGRLMHRPRQHGRLMSARDAIGLALLYAYVRHQSDAVNFLLELDGNWNMTGVDNGTALHRAAWAGDVPMIERLVERGADIANRQNPFTATALSWAHHNRQHDAMAWFRAHCAIDIHDAVSFDFPEHVEARLREDPSSANRRLDQWDIPRAAPLHLAAWTHNSDVEGRYDLDQAARARVVKLLLDSGADPNAVAGNGLTALDIAHISDASTIVALLEQLGAKRARELAPQEGEPGPAPGTPL